MDTKETRRRMKSGQLYYCTDPEVSADQARCNEIVYDYNQTRPSQSQLRQEILKKLLGDLGRTAMWSRLSGPTGDGIPTLETMSTQISI